MNKQSQRGVISPYQLFFIFLVSRAVVALTFYQSILINGISPDSLISSLAAFVINTLLCIPAYLCCSKGKSPLQSKAGKTVYFIYFLFFASVNISRFAFFAAEKTSSGMGAVFFIMIMAAGACYAAFLGIEAIGRFCSACAIASIIVLLLIILLNFKNLQPINFMPFFEGSKKDIIENSFIFSSNSIEPALLLVLFDKCKSNQKKSLFLGIAASYGAIILMLVSCIGVLGCAAPLFAFPVYTLFQMTAFGSFSRLDMLYTAFGFFALFAKCSVIIYCAEKLVLNVPSKTKAPLLFLSSSALSIIIYKRFFDEMINGARDFYFYISIAFLALIPLLSLILTRKEVKNEESN
ncbi:MAG: GerAB/ArcD/ProY family transporter [Eubacterium sp.]|nr:GerAB/ArcD/ProY family transporter [Eubacterium sp.]